MYKFEEILDYVENNDFSAIFYTPPYYDNAMTTFFKKPHSTIEIKRDDDIEEKFGLIQGLIEKGFFAYTTIDYEFGYLLEENLNSTILDKNKVLLRCVFFYESEVNIIKSSELKHSSLKEYLNSSETIIEDLRFNQKKETYIEAVNKIKEYIRNGDTYQVNYTIKSKFLLKTGLRNLFSSLIYNQSAEYTAFINLPNELLLTFSPELFIDSDFKSIKTKPMKGTIARGLNPDDDTIKINFLKNNLKDRAENVMIVDLLRNDLGRICKLDSVKVHNIFTIQKYESLFQMTSSVEGILNNGNISTIMKGIYPCGSITGAPKLRTMEIIQELEQETRGIYTGAIGLLNCKKIELNVAIRTLVINKSGSQGEMGIGSGIVWDSVPEDEYNEVILKARFLTQPVKYFELFETMLIEENEVFLLDYHLERLESSAGYFLFIYKKSEIVSQIKQYVSKLDKTKKYRFKLMLNKWGELNLSSEEFRPEKTFIKILVSDVIVNATDKYLYHKTTNRIFYDLELKKAKNSGYDEVIFVNERGEITEGSISNLIIYSDGKIITPPIESGILAGCYRRHLLQTNPTFLLQPIKISELLNADKVILINSVRGERIVSEISYKNVNYYYQ